MKHLDEVLAALGEAHPWDKATFLLARAPALRGQRPLDVLYSDSDGEVELLVQLASRRGELGS